MKTAGRRSYHKILLSAVVGIIALLFVLETAVRMIIDLPAKTDFYSSIPRDRIPDFQRTVGLKSASGPGRAAGWM